MKLFFTLFTLFVFSCTADNTFQGQAGSSKPKPAPVSQNATSQTSTIQTLQTEEETSAIPAAAGTDDKEPTPDPNHQYYRLVVDSITTCWSPFNLAYIIELELKWEGQWQKNAITQDETGTIGDVKTKISSQSVWSFHGYGVCCDGDNGCAPCGPACAFDGDNKTWWGHVYASAQNSFVEAEPFDAKISTYLQIELSTKKQLQGYKLYGGNNNQNCIPDKYHMEYSDDGSKWTKIPNSEKEAVSFTPQEVTF